MSQERNFSLESLAADPSRKNWEKIVFQSRRAIEACQRSGTPTQLLEEQERLKVYLSLEPKA
jgi:hypothetical protein